MDMETAIKELDQICEFLNRHTDIEKASYSLTNEDIAITVEAKQVQPGLRIWSDHISNQLETVFSRPATVKINCQGQVTVSHETESDLSSVQKKLIGKTTFVFSSFDSKYRLLRIEPDKKAFDSSEMYYQSSSAVSETEIKNINQIFQLATDDHRSGKFIKNILELNVNNIKTPEVFQKFAFAFRQIPKQLTERFIISLVRVPIQQDSAAINKAIGAFRKLISPVFISLELEIYINNAHKVKDLRCDGLVITAGNPQRKDIAGIIRKSNLHQLDKEVLLLYYTRDWKEIPSIHNGLTPMYMKSKISN